MVSHRHFFAYIQELKVTSPKLHLLDFVSCSCHITLCSAFFFFVHQSPTRLLATLSILSLNLCLCGHYPTGKNSFALLSEVDLISVKQNVICKEVVMVIQLKSLSPTQVLPTSIDLSCQCPLTARIEKISLRPPCP